jgi:hypothetical protein
MKNLEPITHAGPGNGWEVVVCPHCHVEQDVRTVDRRIWEPTVQ